MNRGSYGRIPESRYRSSFGRDHRFRIGRGGRFEGGYYRFNYGGYRFGYNNWPRGWGYDDDCYVVYDENCDCYLMYNVRFPGVHISLNIF